MSSPEQRVSILREEIRQLEEYLGTLSPEDWEKPSTCDQWTVADIVAHLTAPAQVYSARIVRALQGDASPPENAPSPGEVQAGSVPFETDIAQRAIALRQRLGEHLLPTFIAAHKELLETLATIGPNDWNRLCYRPQGSESIQDIVDMLINERTVHGWDIRSAFDSDARLSSASLPIVVERVLQRPRWRISRSDATTTAKPIRYRFEVTGPTQYRTDIILTGEHQYTEAVSHVPADMTFRCDGETFVLLMYGRLLADEAISHGRMTFEGDQELAVVFGQRFKGG